MTIGTTTARVSFNCNGVSTVFPIPIQAYSASDFLVLATNPTTGLTTTLVLNSDFTLVASSTDAPPKWTLTTQTGQLPSPYVAPLVLQVILNPVETQQTQYVQGQQFPSLAVQTNVDRLTQMVIRLQDQISRTLLAPDGDVSPGLALPNAKTRALTYQGYDANGNAAVLPSPGGALVTAGTIGLALYPQTAAESAAGVVPSAYFYVPGDTRRYGLSVGSGGDDTTAINNCLRANMLTQFQGALTYNISASLIAQNGATIDLLESTLNLNDPTGLIDHIKVGNGGATRYNNVTIRNGIFTRSQVATGGYAVNFNYVGGCAVSNILVYGNSYIYGGVNVTRGINTNILDSYISNCVAYGVNGAGTGTGANETNGLRVDRNIIQYCPTGLNLGDYVEGLYVRNNVFFRCSTAGASYGAINGRISAKFQQNDFDTCGIGLYAQNLTNITVNENWFSNNTGTSLLLKSTVGSGTVNGSQFYGSTSSNIEIGGSNFAVTGNIISGGIAGIYLKSTAVSITIAGNRITACTYAINSSENPTGVIITGNNLTGNVTGTIGDAGSPNSRYIANNMGLNPIGAASVGVTASPMTYTAGTSPETLSVWGGTNISVTIGGVTYISSATQASFKLGPQIAAVITYSGSPFLTKYIE